MAYHDSLTGLPNRAFFYERIAEMIQIAKQKKETFAVMFIDLDQFKNINDTLGHAMGDLLLIAVSNRLLDSVHKDQVSFLDLVGMSLSFYFLIVMRNKLRLLLSGSLINSLLLL